MNATRIIISLIIVLIVCINGQSLSNSSLELHSYSGKIINQKDFTFASEDNSQKQSSSVHASTNPASLQISKMKAKIQIIVYHSYESYNLPGKFIRHANGLGEISDYTGEVKTVDAEDASFALVRGLADDAYVSFQSKNYPTSYLRHQDGRVKLNDLASDDSQLFKEDATFKRVSGLADPSAVSFESYNYPGHFLRHDSDGHLWVERNDNSQSFKEDATFEEEDPRVPVAPKLHRRPVPPLVKPKPQESSDNDNAQPSANVIMKWGFGADAFCPEDIDPNVYGYAGISSPIAFMDDGTWGTLQRRDGEMIQEIKGNWRHDGDDFWMHDDKLGRDYNGKWSEDEMSGRWKAGDEGGCWSLTRMR